jgi:hypothetical protein
MPTNRAMSTGWGAGNLSAKKGWREYFHLGKEEWKSRSVIIYVHISNHESWEIEILMSKANAECIQNSGLEKVYGPEQLGN